MRYNKEVRYIYLEKNQLTIELSGFSLETYLRLVSVCYDVNSLKNTIANDILTNITNISNCCLENHSWKNDKERESINVWSEREKKKDYQNS